MLCNDLDMDQVDFYLFISSRDSIKFHAENKPHTFILELAERLNLPGRWMVALSDINLNVNVNDCLYVFCDICDISYVRNSMRPILRMIYPTQSSMSYTFPDRYYIPIVQRNFSRLQIYMRQKHECSSHFVRGFRTYSTS